MAVTAININNNNNNNKIVYRDWKNVFSAAM